MDQHTGLGELQTYSLTEHFAGEEKEFTPWLAENIDKIEDIIGLPLNVIEQEASVGAFRVDILAEAEESERTVVIENQFGKTDHKHLGQSLLYTAGKEADVVVWVAEEFRDKHAGVFDWLNDQTDSDVALFAIEASLHKIGESPFAPEFTTIESPDEWSKIIRGEGSIYSRFWNGFVEHLEEQGLNRFTGTSPGDGTGYRITWGSGVNIWPTARFKRDKELMGKIRFTDEESTFAGLDEKEFRDTVSSSVETIDAEFLDQDIGSDINWIEAGEDGKYDKVTITRPVEDLSESNWNEYHQWLTEVSLLFEEALNQQLTDR